MRVLFNTYPVAFDCPGGGEIQILKCKEALASRGIEVLLYDQWQPQFDQADIVHHFSVYGGSSVFCNYVKNRGLPLVISPILWITQTSYRASLYPVDEIRHLLNIGDHLLPNSQAEAEALASIFEVSLEKFTPIVNGVDEHFLEPLPDPQIFLDAFQVQSPFLLNVANIEPRKNQLNLVKAIRDLDIPLVIFGNIRDRAYYDHCVELAQGCMTHLGYLPNHSELLRSAYAACELFVLPSTLETPGLAALEAAATGAKLVITREGCTQEYFGGEAAYVDPNSVDNIREAILMQLSAPLKETLRQHVKANYTWQRAAQQLYQIYSQLL
ncbi:MAG: glycosyl transferase [Leptolyngbya sp.]|nr:MAG: glycosyl transferase [Leptolyngbya sp.]